MVWAISFPEWQKPCRIVDLSETGSQPMHSHDSRLVICFNDEIYNHKALRRDPENRERVGWRGASDTEGFPEYISRLGLPRALEAISGPFAFNLYHLRDRVLHLARDKFGEKPLYYFNRPKMGFNPPIADWLRNEMREWFGETLFEESRGSGWLF